MPAGRYDVLDGAGRTLGTESFRCARGPGGWRYFSEIETAVPEPHREVVDLVVDAAWRPVRLRIETGSHALLLVFEGERLTARRDGEPVEVPFGPEVELDYLSPCFNAVTASRLGRTAEIDVLYLRPVTCEPVRVRQRYELGGDEEVETPVGRFRATRLQYTALDSGWSRPLWVAGDVVVAYEDLFELAEYDPGRSGPFPLA
ncbi:MAG: hypothetical protein ACRDKA_02380 [Actinomycetota bacterium]